VRLVKLGHRRRARVAELPTDELLGTPAASPLSRRRA
jgi:hypothetical protein